MFGIFSCVILHIAIWEIVEWIVPEPIVHIQRFTRGLYTDSSPHPQIVPVTLTRYAYRHSNIEVNLHCFFKASKNVKVKRKVSTLYSFKKYGFVSLECKRSVISVGSTARRFLCTQFKSYWRCSPKHSYTHISPFTSVDLEALFRITLFSFKLVWTSWIILVRLVQMRTQVFCKKNMQWFTHLCNI